jgi:hypothetical protein
MSKDESLKRGADYIDKFSELVEILNNEGSNYIYQYQDIDAIIQGATQEDKPRVFQNALMLHQASIQLKSIAENILIRIEATKEKVPNKDKDSYEKLMNEATILRGDGAISDVLLRSFLIALNTYLVNTEMSEIFQQSKNVVMRLGG